MKNSAVSILLVFISSTVFSQQAFKTYTWTEAKNLHPDTVFSITFEKEKLETVPAELNRFIHLRKLDLSKNKITDLPDFFTVFSELELLDLGKNNLTVFPVEICQLRQLKTLVLNRNDFAYIPDCLSSLTHLELLDIWDTPVETFPETITTMTNLKTIDARGVTHGPQFQKKWKEKLPWVKIEFDAPCNCSE